VDATPTSPDRLGRLREALTTALTEGDPRAAERVVRDAIEAGVPEAVLDAELLAPAMHRIGDLWESGRISVADEHLATDIAFRVLGMQHDAFQEERRRSRQRIMLTAIESERHVLGLQMAAHLLLHAGFDVRLLGADLPISSIRAVVERHRPAVVGFTTTMPNARISDAIAEARLGAPSVGVMIGGPAAVGPAPAADWLITVPRVDRAIDAVHTLLHRPSLN
jgi:methanogenic corrinoid protein MtbC1